MSDTATSTHPNAARRSGPRRLPMWAPPLLFVVAGLIGIVAALPTGSIGLPYLLAFAAAAIVGTMLVDPRGLVVTVTQQPLLFTVITPIVAWLIASWSDPSVGGALDSTPTKTRLITAAYPIVQYFPWMALIPLICTAIAIWRYLDITRVNAKTDKETLRDNARLQKSEETTTVSATRARKRVAESDARVRHSRGKDASRRPASEIIQAAEERRRRAAERARAAQEARRAQEPAPRPVAGDPRRPERSERLERPERPPVQGPERQVRRRDPRAEQRMMEQRAAAGRPMPRRADDRRMSDRRVDDRRNFGGVDPRDAHRDARRPEDPRRGRPQERDARDHRLGDDRAIRRDDRREDRREDRRVAPRRAAARRDDVRRDDVRGRAMHDDGRREANPRRRPVQEWPPRHERPRHSRDDRRD
ncbi:DUF6542 domain-containing protein [Corynebacterium xerosis]|nr:DUF6542 domain-containing protein [Corynebacterium xerosis]